MIMILDVDVTAAGGIIKLIARKGDTTTLGPKGRCPLSASEHNLPPLGGHNPRPKGPSTLTPKACPRAKRCTTLLHNLPRQRRPFYRFSDIEENTANDTLLFQYFKLRLAAFFCWRHFQPGVDPLFQFRNVGDDAY